MKTYLILREQLTPPGRDEIVKTVEVENPDDLGDLVLETATEEAKVRKDVNNIALSTEHVTLMGRPEGTGNRYSLNSSMVRFSAKKYEEQNSDKYYVVAFQMGTEEKDFDIFYLKDHAEIRYTNLVIEAVKIPEAAVFLFTYDRTGQPRVPHTAIEIRDDLENLCRNATIRYIGPNANSAVWNNPSP
jgi:hypothetical protein